RPALPQGAHRHEVVRPDVPQLEHEAGPVPARQVQARQGAEEAGGRPDHDVRPTHLPPEPGGDGADVELDHVVDAADVVPLVGGALQPHEADAVLVGHASFRDGEVAGPVVVEARRDHRHVVPVVAQHAGEVAVAGHPGRPARQRVLVDDPDAGWLSGHWSFSSPPPEGTRGPGASRQARGGNWSLMSWMAPAPWRSSTAAGRAETTAAR